MLAGCGAEPQRPAPQTAAPSVVPPQAAPESPLAPILAETLGAWQRRGAPRTWSALSLDQYLGADAERWRLYDLVDAVVTSYDRTGGSMAFVELYRFRAPADAFGAYSTRRGFDARLVPIDDEAFVTAGALLAWKGSVVLRIVGSTHAPQALEELARLAMEQLPGGGAKPAPLLFLGGQSVVPGTEIWTREDALGYPMFRGSALARIRAGNALIEVLRHPEKSDSDALSVFEAFRGSVTLSARTLDPVLRVGNEAFFAQDAHLTNTLAFRAGTDVVVLRGQVPLDALKRVAEELAGRLRTQPPPTTIPAPTALPNS
ncbi:MAG: DUF6599 family protein [Thermoanaerobaculia bacterium]